MSKYTTGEIAKLCGVSVRTVQYYDSRSILAPSELSEGGRRLYSEEDLKKMQIICFLREMDFSIDNIGELFAAGNSESVIAMLIEQQEELLLKELDEQQKRLDKLITMKRSLKYFDSFSVQSINDVAYVIKNKKKRKRMLGAMLAVGVIMDIIELGTLIYGIKSGNWIPLLLGIPVIVAMGIFISQYYFARVAYICPECHNIFKPEFSKALGASHTPNTRRLTCPECNKKSYCLETYQYKGKK